LLYNAAFAQRFAHIMEQLEFFSIPSPCIGVCQANSKGYCKGCLRSREERLYWLKLTDTQKQNNVTVNPAEFVGRSLLEVTNELSQMGLQVKPEGVDSNEAKDTVLSVSPSGSVEKGTSIIVKYSNGPKTATIPTGLIGQDKDTASAAIVKLGINVNQISEHSDTAAPGTVLRITPLPGTQVPLHSSVDVYIADASYGQGSGGAAPSANTSTSASASASASTPPRQPTSAPASTSATSSASAAAAATPSE